ncbi:MAG TPA: Gfo/Idh/MocA family oxidoreductase [Sumerlaeia bacterium]|nr:Gfo/Idh/MocA family oxidoreductase [Sumerlaeia bacterium]
MKRVKAAVIGCGAIGAVHAEHYAASPMADLAYVVDIIPHKANVAARKAGPNTKAITDYREALADPSVDAVSVCLPNNQHCPVTLEWLEAGKHVMCEKPIALNAEEAERMRAMAKKKKRMLVIGVVNRFNDGVLHVRDAIQKGQIGNVYHVSVMFKQYRCIPGLGGWFTTKAEAGGGVMIDWGVHYLDLALFCLGFPKPRSISGTAHAVLGRDVRKYAYLDMWAGPPNYKGVCDVEEFAAGVIRTDGPAVSFEGAWAQNVQEAASHIDFLGDKGGIHLRYMGNFTLYTDKNGVLYRTEPSYRSKNMYQVEIESFLECLIKGKPSPADIDTVMATQRILDGFYESAAKNREVAIGD